MADSNSIDNPPNSERAPRAVLNLDEAAALAKCHRETLRKLMREGKAPGTKIGRSWVTSTSVFQQWLDARCRERDRSRYAADLTGGAGLAARLRAERELRMRKPRRTVGSPQIAASIVDRIESARAAHERVHRSPATHLRIGRREALELKDYARRHAAETRIVIERGHLSSYDGIDIEVFDTADSFLVAAAPDAECCKRTAAAWLLPR